MAITSNSGWLSRQSAVHGRGPTFVRWRIAGLMFCITVLMFLDRMNISVAARYIQLEFSLDNIQVGYILSAYVVGYALFQIPGGMLGDRFGPRALLTFAVLWWSAFTALTAAPPKMAGLPFFSIVGAFCLMRFLVGVGEAAALPNCSKTVALWMAPEERGLGNAVYLTGIGVGGAISAPFIAGLMSVMGWRAPFLICALLGAPVASLWYWYARNRPEQHPHVNQAELAAIGRKPDANYVAHSRGVELRSLFRTPSFLALIISYFLQGYVIYIFYTWFYLYVVTVRGFDIRTAGLWGATPFIAVSLTTPLGGFISDRAVRRFGSAWGRRIPVLLGTACSGLLLLVGARVALPQAAVILLGSAAGALNFALTNWWATVNDMSAEDSGTLSGIMNTSGNFGGVVSPVLTPWIAGRLGWIHALDFAAIVVVSAGLLWLLIGPARQTRSLDFPNE